MSGIDIRKIIDLERFWPLMNSFCEIVGIASAIIDLEGVVLTQSNWQRICVNYYRKHPETYKRCIESDTVLANKLQAGEKYAFYTCHNGLTDAASPIIVRDEHVANLFVGQFFLAPPNVEEFKERALKYGFDEHFYTDVLHSVPIIPEQKVRVIFDTLSGFAELLGDIGLIALTNEETNRLLAESEQLLQTILKASPVGISYAKNRKIVWANETMRKLFGFTKKSEFVNKSTRNLYETKEEFQRVGKLVYEGFESGKPIETDALFKRKDGTPFIGHVRVSTVHPDNPWDGVVVNIFDITERRRLEEQVLFAQKMDAIDTLSGGIAHDFNNIMSTVLGYASFLGTECKNNEKLTKGLKAIEKAAIRASELTSQLLAYSRKEILAIKPVDLNRVVRETFDLISKTFDKSIKTEAISADLPLVVQGDESQLAQVIMNLALNAQSAMPEGGTLTIETSWKDLTDGFTVADFHIEPGKYVRLKISDTGIGMDKETMKRMYEPYFSTKEKSGGTGLGLSVVYGIVKSHSGYIYADSEQDRGTDFFVLLPASDHEEVREPEPDTPVAGGNETILVVDDERDILVMLKDVLEDHGYSVYIAQNGIEGLALYMRHRSKIDLIILDIKMPEMDGRMFLERLIEYNMPAKVLAMSGYSERESYESLINTRASDFIAKPFHVGGILKKVREVLD